jgi:hypothetical protein
MQRGWSLLEGSLKFNGARADADGDAAGEENPWRLSCPVLWLQKIQSEETLTLMSLRSSAPCSLLVSQILTLVSGTWYGMVWYGAPPTRNRCDQVVAAGSGAG